MAECEMFVRDSNPNSSQPAPHMSSDDSYDEGFESEADEDFSNSLRQLKHEDFRKTKRIFKEYKSRKNYFIGKPIKPKEGKPNYEALFEQYQKKLKIYEEEEAEESYGGEFFL